MYPQLTFLTFISVTKYVACGTAPRFDKTTPTSDGPCKERLWAHTYGAMARFGQLKPNYSSLYDRHNLDHRCVFDVKGVVQAVGRQPGGDMKVYLTLDDANFAYAGAVSLYVPLKKNEFYPLGDMVDGKKRWMVAEIVCAAPKQKRGKGIDPKTGKEWKLPEEWSPVTDSQNDGAVIACRGYDNTVYIPHPRGSSGMGRG